MERNRDPEITGSRKISNFCWAFIPFFGSLGFIFRAIFGLFILTIDKNGLSKYTSIVK